MKPLNASDPGCNPVSSNCVIWQGPDISCINLCKGDSISEVVYKLATELCNILDTLNITAYDFECLNLSGCGPSNFQELIQVLINQICIANTNISSATSKAIGSSSSTTEESIAPCFYYTNPLGDTVTFMTVEEYAKAIGNRVCSIITQITTINSAIAGLNTRVSALEATPAPTLTLPQVTPDCVLPSVPTDMDIVLDALEDQFCQLRDVTGTPLELSSGIFAQCVTGSTERLAGSGTMSTLSGWKNTPTLVSDTLINLWLTICDVRSAVRNIQLNCCPSGCDGISLDISMNVISGNIVIYINGTIPAEFVACGGGTTIFTVSDGINSSNVAIDVIAYLNNPLGYSYTFPIVLDPSANLTVSSTICLYNPNTGTTCSNCVSYTYMNTASCPELELTVDGENPLQINWSFIVTLAGIYTIELYTNTDVFITSVSSAYAVDLMTPQTGSFTATTYGTYKVRVNFTSGANTVTCPFESITLTEPIIL